MFACTQVVPASQFGLGPGLRKTQYGNWTPRVGFAFRPFRDNRTVLRGGIGSFTQTILGFVAYAATGIHTSDVRSYENYEGPGIAPRFTFPQTHAGQFALRQPGNGSFASAINPEYRDPRSYQWNITVERLLSPTVSMRLSYVGTQSVGLTNQVELNQVPASTVPFAASRKPYPVWSSVHSLDNVGFANYQSLQTQVARRFGGMMIQASYTLAKHLGNAGGPGGGLGNQPVYGSEYMPRVLTDRFNTRLDRGNLAASRRHRFVLSGIFPIPLGKGRMIGKFNWFTDLLVGGWDLSTIMLIQSGELQTPIMAPLLDQSNTNFAGRSLVTARPDRIADGNLNEPAPDRFYDIAAFVPTPAGAGRFGNSGVGILRGPHMAGLSAGLSKTVRMSDQVRIRIEGTFTNVPNHPNFLSPLVNISNPQAFGRLTTVRTADNGGNRTGQLSFRLEF